MTHGQSILIMTDGLMPVNNAESAWIIMYTDAVS